MIEQEVIQKTVEKCRKIDPKNSGQYNTHKSVRKNCDKTTQWRREEVELWEKN
jgi:hypothetical protein